MEITIKGEAKEITALVLQLQERQEVIKPPREDPKSMIKATEKKLSKLKSLPPDEDCERMIKATEIRLSMLKGMLPHSSMELL